jgi:hypothetical protein
VNGAHPASPVPCIRCQSPLDEADLRCTICGLTVPVSGAAPTRARAKILRCEECGAAVTYRAQVRAPQCGFCEAVMQLERPEDPIEEPDWYVPFVVTPERAQAALQRWFRTLGTFFRPSDLKSASRLQSVHPVWWVAWLCDAQARVSWTADSNAGARRAAWAPHAGQTQMRFDALLVPASRGLSQRECVRLSTHYDVRPSQPEPHGPPGAVSERFDLQRAFARQLMLDGIHAAAAARLEREVIPGRRFRNLHIVALLSDLRTRRIALPAYILVYRYRDRVYRAVVHGQDERCAFGDAPRSWVKLIVLLLVLLLLLVGGLLFAFLLMVLGLLL